MADAQLTLSLVSLAGMLAFFGACQRFDQMGFDLKTRRGRITSRVFDLFSLWWLVGTLVIALGTFGYGWWWSVMNWGWLLGIAFGWVPSLVVAALAALAWPFVLWIGAIVLIFWERLS